MTNPAAASSGQAPQKFKAGDLVTWVNDYGVKFPERRILRLDEENKGNEPRYFVEPNSAYWMSVHESKLMLDAVDPVLGIVGGHKIRAAECEGEQWFLVGLTQTIFSTLALAEQFAQENALSSSDQPLASASPA